MTDALKLENQLCFAVHSTAHAIARAYRPLLDPIGITYPQYLVLLVLWEQDRLSVSDIGARLLLDSGTLTPLLKRLEAAGYVLRRRCRSDERQVEVTLTEAGKALKSQAVCIPERMAGTMGEPIRDLMLLKSHLDHLRANLVGETPEN